VSGTLREAVGAWPRANFLGVGLDAPTVEAFRAWMLEALAAPADARTTRTIAYLNAATSNQTSDDPEHAARLNRCDIVYADGMGVVWGAKWRGVPIRERVNAGDFILPFLESLRSPVKLALWGGTTDLARNTAEVFGSRLPKGSQVWSRHGYDAPDAWPEEVERLLAWQADLVLLGLGAPRQERLAELIAAGAERHPRRPAIVWSVGALFEYFAGGRYRAPWWVRRIGMEWLVRLALEPKRLGKRYILGNPRFVWRVLVSR